MDPFDPILDQPQSIDYERIHSSATYRLANQDISLTVDARTDLQDLLWPWADVAYVRSINLRIRDPQGEELMVLVTRYYAGYQETILGNEGMIVSKRVAVPLSSNYDRAVLWTLECQAEGDRLLRLDISIDWGESLTQRVVDGLLVAQRNPGRAQGIYAQQNAESTRVFGNPHGRPSAYEFDDEGRAQLVYYVLVNGIVEVPLLLAISDVGEQVAWNGFLALRDSERSFELSIAAWDKVMHTGRLWTSDPRLNRAVQAGRLATVRHYHRLRTGMAPDTRRVEDVPVLLKSLDTFDVVQSRNLLANLRRVAERAGGRLPELLPVRPKDPIPDPGARLANTNSAYLNVLLQHLQRHPNVELLHQHYEAVKACAEALVQLRAEMAAQDKRTLAVAGGGLRLAARLAAMHEDGVNSARWESEACELEQLAGDVDHQPKTEETTLSMQDWRAITGWEEHTDRPWGFAGPQIGSALAGDAVWSACGIEWRQGNLWVCPQAGNAWKWWALQDLPLGGETVSLVWDGSTLYTTCRLQSDQPVKLCSRIRIRSADELDFDLHFEMMVTVEHEAGGSQDVSGVTFRPVFDTA